MKYYYKIHNFSGSLPEDKYQEKYDGILDDIQDPRTYVYTYMLAQKAMAPHWKRAEKFELQNGCDVRRFQEEGVKEISEESYNWIVEEDKRIVASRTEKSKRLIKEFLPAEFENSWHRPFKEKEDEKTQRI